MRQTPPVRIPVAAFVALAFAVFGAFTLLQGQARPVSPATRAPDATPAQTAAPEATASITGQVVAADTGAPVKRARVTVMGGTPPTRPQGAEAGAAVQLQTVTSGTSGPSLPPGMVRRETETSETGRFEFADLPAGRLVISTQAPAGFLFPTPQTVEVAVGGSASVTIRLERAGAITGRVLDHEGDPLVRAQVMACQRRSVGGAWRMMTTGSASTDDLGQFRLFGLAPGDFYVRAAYSMPSATTVAPGAGPRLGYAPTFYPSALDIDGAQQVSVRKGQDTVGIEVMLQRAKVATVSGRAADSAGNPLAPRRGYVSLSQYLEGAGPGGFGARQQEDGTFSFQNVPPGRYLLSATAGMSEGPNGMPSERASRTVIVDGDDVIADIQTNSGATVSGRVVVEGTGAGSTAAAPGPTGPARIMVSARPSDPMTGVGGFSAGQPTPAAEDGTFQLTGLRGALLPQASGSRAVLRSVTYGGEDIVATGLTLAGTERIEGVTITLTTETAMIDGMVTTSGGEPAEAWIIVFPDDETRWFPMSPFVRIGRSRPTAAASGGRGAPAPSTSPGASPSASAASRLAGGFVSPMLLPGRYAVVVLPVNDGSYPSPGTTPATDRESLRQLRAGAKLVSLTAGQTVTLQLQLKK